MHTKNSTKIRSIRPCRRTSSFAKAIYDVATGLRLTLRIYIDKRQINIHLMISSVGKQRHQVFVFCTALVRESALSVADYGTEYCNFREKRHSLRRLAYIRIYPDSHHRLNDATARRAAILPTFSESQQREHTIWACNGFDSC